LNDRRFSYVVMPLRNRRSIESPFHLLPIESLLGSFMHRRIETVRQLERLVELNCQFGQGFYFSPPMEAKAALAFMQQQLATAKAGT
jgi:c-di-GMP-related signal transduction protein